MRLIILNQFFYPDHSATSQLMTDLAESLVQDGVEVTALSSRGRYNGGGRLTTRETHHGVHIERAWSTSCGKRNAPARLSDYLSFYLGASWKLLRLPRHDLIMALTTPPLVGLLAVTVGRLRGSRVVSLVQDIYPDVAVQLGALQEKKISTRLLAALNRFTLRRSDRIIVLGECMRERINALLGEEYSGRVDVIHNWADGSEIKPLADEANPFRTEHGLDSKFVVLFSGNLGRVNEFRTVLEAARILRDESKIIFLFIGEGAKAAEINEFARAQGLDNIRMLPYEPRERLKYSLAAGDVSLVTLAEGLAGLSVPSKTYGILAAGRPILFVGDAGSSAASIVREHQCGAVIQTNDAAALAGTITAWSQDPERLARMSRSARQAFEKHFSRSRAVSAYLETFVKCLESSRSPKETRTVNLEETSS